MYHETSLRHDPLVFFKLEGVIALAGVAQWIECPPADQWIAGSITSQVTCLGFGPGPQ